MIFQSWKKTINTLLQRRYRKTWQLVKNIILSIQLNNSSAFHHERIWQLIYWTKHVSHCILLLVLNISCNHLTAKYTWSSIVSTLRHGQFFSLTNATSSIFILFQWHAIFLDQPHKVILRKVDRSKFHPFINLQLPLLWHLINCIVTVYFVFSKQSKLNLSLQRYETTSGKHKQNTFHLF